MPKIRDLGISTIPFAPSANAGPIGYQMVCLEWTVDDGNQESACSLKKPWTLDQGGQEGACQRWTREEPPDSDGDSEPKKNARGLPHHAVVQLRQQLHQQIHGYLQ